MSLSFTSTQIDPIMHGNPHQWRVHHNNWHGLQIPTPGVGDKMTTILTTTRWELIWDSYHRTICIHVVIYKKNIIDRYIICIDNSMLTYIIRIMNSWTKFQIGLQFNCNNLLIPPPPERNQTQPTSMTRDHLSKDWPLILPSGRPRFLWRLDVPYDIIWVYEKNGRNHSLPQQHSWYGMGCDCPSDYHKCGIST